MSTQQDIRWLQRFSNFQKALEKLRKAVEIVGEKMDFDEEIDELLEEGVIQRFEYIHENSNYSATALCTAEHSNN